MPSDSCSSSSTFMNSVVFCLLMFAFPVRSASSVLQIRFEGEPLLVSNLYKMRNDLSVVVIDEGFTIIGEALFKGSSVTAVTLPQTLREIEADAFASTKLATLTLPNQTEILGSQVFLSCTSLMYIFIPRSVTSIGSGIFRKCSTDINIDIDPENTRYSFRDGLLRELNDETVGTRLLLAVNKFTEMQVPPDISIIVDRSLNDNSKLVTINCTNVTYLDQYVFEGCSSLATVYLGERVSRINGHCFDGVSNLANIFVDQRNPYFKDVDGIVYARDPYSVEFVPPKKTHTTFDLGEVETVGSAAFALSKVTQFQVSTSNPNVSVYNGVAYNKDYTVLMSCPPCLSSKNFTFHKNVLCVANEAFYMQKNLESLVVPEGVEEVKVGGFACMKALTSITLPSTLSYLGPAVFHAVIVSELVIPSQVTELADRLCMWSRQLVSVHVKGKVTTIGRECFYQATKLTSVNLPESLQIIEDGAFFHCECLMISTLVFYEGLQYIGTSAFSSCYALNGSLTIPSTVTKIGSNAFYLVDEIESVLILNCNTHVGQNAFMKRTEQRCVMSKYFTEHPFANNKHSLALVLHMIYAVKVI